MCGAGTTFARIRRGLLRFIFVRLFVWIIYVGFVCSLATYWLSYSPRHNEVRARGLLDFHVVVGPPWMNLTDRQPFRLRVSEGGAHFEARFRRWQPEPTHWSDLVLPKKEVARFGALGAPEHIRLTVDGRHYFLAGRFDMNWLLWPFAVLAAMITAVRVFAWIRRRRRSRSRCAVCRHNLQDPTAAICPGCGRALVRRPMITARMLLRFAFVRLPLWLVGIGFVLSLAACGLSYSGTTHEIRTRGLLDLHLRCGMPPTTLPTFSEPTVSVVVHEGNASVRGGVARRNPPPVAFHPSTPSTLVAFGAPSAGRWTGGECLFLTKGPRAYRLFGYFGMRWVLWPLGLVVALIVAGKLLLWWRLRQLPSVHCRTCGYDLRGNVTGTCPECGDSTVGVNEI